MIKLPKDTTYLTELPDDPVALPVAPPVIPYWPLGTEWFGSLALACTQAGV